MARTFVIGRAAEGSAIGRQVRMIREAREAQFARQRAQQRTVSRPKVVATSSAPAGEAALPVVRVQPETESLVVQDGKWKVVVVVGRVVSTTNPAREYVERNVPRRFVRVGTGCDTGHRSRC